MVPSRNECLSLFEELKVPENVRQHCIAVETVAEKLASIIFGNGSKKAEICARAALLHDICKLSSPSHSDDGAKLVERRGWNELAKPIRNHALHKALEAELSTEDKIVYYADKRVIGNKIVSLQDRLSYIRKRYGTDNGTDNEMLQKIIKSEEKANEIEKELMQIAGADIRKIGL